MWLAPNIWNNAFFVYVVTTLIFPRELKAKCQFFDKRDYPVSVVQAAHNRAQQIERQTAEKYTQLRRKTQIAFHSLSHFTLTTTQLNPSFLKNFKLL